MKLLGLLCFGLSYGQTISIEQLSHRVPASAAREYVACTRALGTGDLARSIAHCRKAIATDPENASAHNDLGVLYLNSGMTEEALAEFKRAIALQPTFSAAALNAGFASLSFGEFENAERFARTALDSRKLDHRGNLLLGWSLVAQNRYTAAALESLQIAARDFPEAHLAAADLHMHQASFDKARAEVEAYLESGSEEYRALAESWLHLLTFN